MKFMKTLNSNEELYGFMLELASKLKLRGHDASAARLISASNTASGLSSEFLGECMLALKELRGSNGLLLDSEVRDVVDVIDQLQKALNRERR